MASLMHRLPLDVLAVTGFHDRSLGTPEEIAENLADHLADHLAKNLATRLPEHLTLHLPQPLPAHLPDNWYDNLPGHLRETMPEAGMPPTPEAALWIAITDNHRCNRRLWHQEDLARRRDVPADRIVDCKRQIDRYNQQRNDASEAMDTALLRQLADIKPASHARRHSETPGAMIDRLSILSLKIFHMGRQAENPEANDDHRDLCRQKWACLNQQRADLAECLEQLMQEIIAGNRYFSRYQQFKMYNDPALNPYLRGSDDSAATTGP